jgi:hypothetical protein
MGLLRRFTPRNDRGLNLLRVNSQPELTLLAVSLRARCLKPDPDAARI